MEKYTPEMNFGPNQQGVTDQYWEPLWSLRDLLPGDQYDDHMMPCDDNGW